MQLTENEKTILKAGCDSEYESIVGGVDWVFATIDNSGLDAKVARGVISSLIKKGLVMVDKRDGEVAIYATKEGENVCMELGFDDGELIKAYKGMNRQNR